MGILVLGDKPRFNMEWVIGLLNNVSDPVHRLMSIAFKASQIVAQISALQGSDSTTTAAKVSTWIESSKSIDRELYQWTQHVPDHWLPFIVYSQDGKPLITHQHIWMVGTWNYYRACRVLLQRLLLTLYRKLACLEPQQHGSSNSTAYLKVQEVIQGMITDICRSIPFSVGDVDTFGKPTRSCSSSSSSSSEYASATAFSAGTPRIRAFHGHSMLWPLWYALSSGFATPGQVQLIRSVLARVGSAMGIKLALTLAAEGVGSGSAV